MADLGSDISGVKDLDPALSVVSGRTALAQAILRRIRTPRGQLEEDPFYGYDLREVIGTTTTNVQVLQRVLAQVRAEEEVEEVYATIQRSNGQLNIYLTVTEGDGPFELTITATEFDVELLEAA